MNHHGNLVLLLDDYAGKVSEMTAITQYIHHYLVVDKEDVAELLEKIAIQEMHHLEELGETLNHAGIDPRFYDRNKNYWAANFVDYQYDVCDILRSDIQGELQAIAQYYQHIQAIPQQHIQMMLENIIKDEVVHIQMLMAKMAKYCSSHPPQNWLAGLVNSMSTDHQLKDKLTTMLRLK